MKRYLTKSIKFNIFNHNVFSSFMKKQNIKSEIQKSGEKVDLDNYDPQKPNPVTFKESNIQIQLKQVQMDLYDEMQQLIDLKQKLIDDEINLPYKLYGMKYEQPTKVGFLSENVFAHHKIPKDMVFDHLNKIFTGTLYAIADKEEEFLNEYCEKSFANRLIKSVQNLQEKNYKFEIYEDKTGIRGEPIPNNYRVCDMTMIRGLNVDREQNQNESDYHKHIDIDEMGLVVYTPLNITDSENFINKKDGDKMYDQYKMIVMRVLLEIQSPLRLKIQKPDGSFYEIDNNEYEWRHLALFETQMKPPPQFKSSYKLENYMEWISKFKMGVWKLVDVDNYMKGNPLIIKQNIQDKFDDEIFKGSKYDPDHNIDIKRV